MPDSEADDHVSTDVAGTEITLTVEVLTSPDDDTIDVQPKETTQQRNIPPHIEPMETTQQLILPPHNSTFCYSMTDTTMADARPECSTIFEVADVDMTSAFDDVVHTHVNPDDQSTINGDTTSDVTVANPDVADVDMTSAFDDVVHTHVNPDDQSTINGDTTSDVTVANPGVADVDMTSAFDDVVHTHLNPDDQSIINGDTTSDVTVANHEISVGDVSFNVSSHIEETVVIEERSVDDPELSESIVEDMPVQFEIFDNGSQRGGRKLVSSDGYSYTYKVRHDNGIEK